MGNDLRVLEEVSTAWRSVGIVPVIRREDVPLQHALDIVFHRRAIERTKQAISLDLVE
jgi:hypothetical protein